MSSTSPVLDVQTKPSLEFPDDPLKWEGWSNYKADNLYERLCLDPRAKPGDEQIQQHCTALLQWWQKKVRLKNQPNNPMTQLLGRGIDEARSTSSKPICSYSIPRAGERSMTSSPHMPSRRRSRNSPSTSHSRSRAEC